jgi:hypothetical protein
MHVAPVFSRRSLVDSIDRPFAGRLDVTAEHRSLRTRLNPRGAMTVVSGLLKPARAPGETIQLSERTARDPVCFPGLEQSLNGGELKPAGVLSIEGFELASIHVSGKVHREFLCTDGCDEGGRYRTIGRDRSRETSTGVGLYQKLTAALREIEKQVGDIGLVAGRRGPWF